MGVVVGNVEPRESVQLQLRPRRVPRRNTLEIRIELTLAVQRLALPGSLGKLGLVLLNFGRVFPPAPESESRLLVSEQEATEETQDTSQSEGISEACRVRPCRVYAFIKPQQSRSSSGGSSPQGIVVRSHVPDHPAEMGVRVDEGV